MAYALIIRLLIIPLVAIGLGQLVSGVLALIPPYELSSSLEFPGIFQIFLNGGAICLASCTPAFVTKRSMQWYEIASFFGGVAIMVAGALLTAGLWEYWASRSHPFVMAGIVSFHSFCGAAALLRFSVWVWNHSGTEPPSQD